LKLKGDFEIFIEKSTRIPVLVKGQIPNIGRVEVKLLEVGLNQ
jgi:hypothetical protein